MANTLIHTKDLWRAKEEHNRAMDQVERQRREMIAQAEAQRYASMQNQAALGLSGAALQGMSVGYVNPFDKMAADQERETRERLQEIERESERQEQEARRSHLLLLCPPA